MLVQVPFTEQIQTLLTPFQKTSLFAPLELTMPPHGNTERLGDR